MRFHATVLRAIVAAVLLHTFAAHAAVDWANLTADQLKTVPLSEWMNVTWQEINTIPPKARR